MERPQTRTEWQQLLEKRLRESGLSARRFAIDVLRRDERTVRRWLDGEQDVPHVVQEFLLDPRSAPWP
jgi:hypothetical protein